MRRKSFESIRIATGGIGVEKRYERRQDKAKFGEKAEFMCDK
jgi:hypothetical protein